MKNLCNTSNGSSTSDESDRNFSIARKTRVVKLRQYQRQGQGINCRNRNSRLVFLIDEALLISAPICAMSVNVDKGYRSNLVAMDQNKYFNCNFHY